MIDYGHSRRDERDPGVSGKENVKETLTAGSPDKRTQLGDMRESCDDLIGG